DYVAVNFAITDVPKSKVNLPLDKVYNKNLYVSLKQEGRYYVVDQVSETKPKQGVYLKGKFRESFNELGQAATYRVDYSLDKYFVEQGSGKKLEQESIQGGLIGTVKVLAGYGVLTGIAQS
ncbi:MAG: GDYXXLXY domain-containing protein, partial [Desulfosporosinus sp.]|nr:GDYXXLXY domain-containing protein [Desulfosporosinus sp.]